MPRRIGGKSLKFRTSCQETHVGHFPDDVGKTKKQGDQVSGQKLEITRTRVSTFGCLPFLDSASCFSCSVSLCGQSALLVSCVCESQEVNKVLVLLMLVLRTDYTAAVTPFSFSCPNLSP